MLPRNAGTHLCDKKRLWGYGYHEHKGSSDVVRGVFIYIVSCIFLGTLLIISTIIITAEFKLRQHRTIPALRLKHRSDGCGTASALPKCSIMSGCGTRIVLRGQKPLALCDRCPCFGSLFPPLAALTFAASSIICAFGLASAAPRSPYRHLELCGIALKQNGCLPPYSEKHP